MGRNQTSSVRLRTEVRFERSATAHSISGVNYWELAALASPRLYSLRLVLIRRTFMVVELSGASCSRIREWCRLRLAGDFEDKVW